MLKTDGLPSVFFFLCDFLAAILLSAVPTYGDENKITSSASKCDNPLRITF